jgi:hypothetical protein
MIEGLERILRRMGIVFSAAERRIRYDYVLSFYLNTYGIFTRCFPHIVNLACKAVLGTLTEISFIDETQEGYEDYDPVSPVGRDCIATIRSLISTVCVQKSVDLLYC